MDLESRHHYVSDLLPSLLYFLRIFWMWTIFKVFIKFVTMLKKQQLSIPKMKIMASGPITSWQIDGGTMEAMTDFIILGSKITEDVECSHYIKMLAPWKI